MKRLFLFLLLLLPTAAKGQDVATVRFGPSGPTVLAVWLGDAMFVLPGPLPLNLLGLSQEADHLEATWVSTGGALVHVYVDCSKRTSEVCMQMFQKRVAAMEKFLPVDKEATKKYLGIK